MAFFDYFCETNGKTVEVQHKLGKKLKNWGEVCKLAKIDPGKTPLKSPVVKMIGGITPTIFKTKGLDKDDYGTKLRV